MESPLYVLEFEKPLRELMKQLDELRQRSIETNVDLRAEIQAIESKIESTQRDIYSNLSPWQKVQIARHPKRPYALDYVGMICENFQELHGDRQYNDDRALVGGTAYFDGQAVMIVAQQKGRDPKERMARNFGMPKPEGYRKAIRLMRLAEKFGIPVLTFIDTPGAFPGVESEERHVSEAIAYNLREMSLLKTPTVSIVVGEGGSGGALGIGVTDRVLIFENSYYSVISPEGCAAILWKDSAAAPRAAEALKVSADHLEKLGVVDEVVPEPLGGAHHDPQQAASALKYIIQKHLNDLRGLSTDQLLDARYQRYRHLGVYEEAGKVKS
ncbi:acetyl-CoA carboxylase carboxyltransferase subunit alpha [Opitutus sp. ER46]|uniref:acetyl-CoA carboxylase carboxyltransferase subunit alpha n=1 Tax=Opitutus sp. ER46 TaxID=2161864 RepID=UPI000D2FD7B9|nr:acetyl-CoA carboxylase carboxyltransferase subunit alpha [Opitutus sp. ER46]PTX96410.1 acetyl-CoA carboxylase carboxyl transferase subunit alpha [Opitutus sp. ER46]